MQKRYDVKDFGALGDGRTLCTQSLQRAIDTASEAKCPVYISEGTFLSGSLFLRENTRLVFEKDAILLGSQDLSDYAIEETRFEGRICIWPIALVNAKNVNNISMEGQGIIDGNGLPFWTQFWNQRAAAIKQDEPFSNRDVMRPRLLFFENCKNVSVSGITLQNAAFWHFHLYLCQHVCIDSIAVRAPHKGVRAASSDAIDIDASSGITIKNSFFETDDDCICLKSGKGPTAHLVNPPTEQIVIENCIFGFGHGVVTLGSEAALVRNITVKNCQVVGENSLVRCKFRTDTRQEFSKILFDGITISNGGWLFDVRTWNSRQDEILALGRQPSFLTDMIVRNIIVKGLVSPGILGEPNTLLTMKGILLENISITCLTDGSLGLTRSDSLEQQTGGLPGCLTYDIQQDISFTNVMINGKPL
ncbi:glycosyl hydrolase family 28 protein [uncultured Sphaerochaeta sp.]|uniref:glycoside hydrolase family 28 protein n=1 Tax=uncultured Sphaerochaeta sp. TaxID=886478 RepID=UPI002A0A6F1C|nr:glycosyl hydrolase family 28 protein [uncultured Sphaerochaeta sp.]